MRRIARQSPAPRRVESRASTRRIRLAAVAILVLSALAPPVHADPTGISEWTASSTVVERDWHVPGTVRETRSRPRPGTTLLVTIGLLGLAVQGRRRRSCEDARGAHRDPSREDRS